jgi:hypothetical protein
VGVVRVGVVAGWLSPMGVAMGDSAVYRRDDGNRRDDDRG